MLMMEGVGCELAFRKKLVLGALRLPVVAAMIVLGVVQIRAQSPPPNASASAPRFDVASIKPHKTDQQPLISGGRFTEDGFSATAVTPQWLIRLAYDEPQSRRIAGAPNWLNSDSERYDVEAKMDSSAVDEDRKLTPDQRLLARRRMLQALLEDRFKLTLHRETKDLPIFALVIAKNGPKLHEVKAGDPAPTGPFAPNHGHVVRRGGLPVLVWALSESNDIDRVVVDKTGLSGIYDFNLEWTMEGKGDSGPSIFTAIEQQLGLRLESQKGPVEILVIDHVERPSEN